MNFLSDIPTDSFMPHGHCYLWTPEVLWLHVVSDSIIVLAYFCIPFLLAFIVFRARLYHRFDNLFLLFSIFIFACGTTHLMEIVNVWQSRYILSGLIKAITAIASLITAIMLIPNIPEIIKALQQMEASEKAEALREG